MALLHDIDIERGPLNGVSEVTVQDVHAIGTLVRVELVYVSELIEIELTPERANVFKPVKGQQSVAQAASGQGFCHD